MAIIAVNNFITMVTNSQLQKKGSGGRRTHWTDRELADMKQIAEQVVIGNYSSAQVVKFYKEQMTNKHTIGSLRANKTPTAFRKKLNQIVREMRAEIKSKEDANNG